MKARWVSAKSVWSRADLDLLTMDNALPCPTCESKKDLKMEFDFAWTICCRGDCADLGVPIGSDIYTPEMAIANWNAMVRDEICSRFDDEEIKGTIWEGVV